jgi:hypothetical protein
MTIGPGKAARIFNGLAYGMIVPWMLIAVILLIFVDMPNGGRGGGYAIVGFMFIPPAIIALIGSLLPSSRRIVCTCGWRKDYPALPPRNTDAQLTASSKH